MGEQPRPKSPPGYVDLYGKRRQQAKLQVLEREISFLQEELKSLEAEQPTSRSCKELNEFLAAKPDPFIADKNQKNPEAGCSWKRMSGCCKSDNVHHQQQARKNHRGSCCCSCCSREYLCPKCSGCKGCSCFHQNCCCFKLSLMHGSYGSKLIIEVKDHHVNFQARYLLNYSVFRGSINWKVKFLI